MGRDHLRTILSFVALLVLAGALLAQDLPGPGTAQKSEKTFVVNGKTVDAQVVDIDGRSYVDVDSLTQIAQLTNGTITVDPNRIVLTIPVAPSSAPAAAPGTAATCRDRDCSSAGSPWVDETVCGDRDRRSRGIKRVERSDCDDDYLWTRRQRGLGQQLS